jgi:hypothetical protein
VCVTAFWQEHSAKTFGAITKQSTQRAMKRNNGTRSQRASSVNLRLTAVMCVSLRFGKSIWQENLTRTFGKNTKSRAHSEQCSRNNGTRSQWASGVNLRLFAVMCESLHFLASILARTFGMNTTSRAHSEQ